MIRLNPARILADIRTFVEPGFGLGLLILANLERAVGGINGFYFWWRATGCIAAMRSCKPSMRPAIFYAPKEM